MLATIASILGVCLLIAAVGGLAGLWWALAAAGFALLVFAVLDRIGSLAEVPRRAGGDS